MSLCLARLKRFRIRGERHVRRVIPAKAGMTLCLGVRLAPWMFCLSNLETRREMEDVARPCRNSPFSPRGRRWREAPDEGAPRAPTRPSNLFIARNRGRTARRSMATLADALRMRGPTHAPNGKGVQPISAKFLHSKRLKIRFFSNRCTTTLACRELPGPALWARACT
jgi:hypothetical protein